ncbi:MAG: hypothetical protein QGG42_07415 [Phycisphaerae bacterium]|jgi:hypothetical protein|nr:hypothetical protein [Phycisphaerae bacterium]
MFYDQTRRTRVLRRFGALAILISMTAVLGGCDSTRPFGDTILDGLGTAGRATVGGLETAGRATVGGLQWAVDGGETGIRGRTHGTTPQPFVLVTGLRFPGIKLEELRVLSLSAVDGRGKPLGWKEGAWTKSKYGPALTITVEPEQTTRVVDITAVLIYRGGRWTLSARCVASPSDPQGGLWTTELLTVTRQ